MTETSKPLKESLDKGDFSKYAEKGQESEGETLVSHIEHLPVVSLQEQFELLGSISNYHWWSSSDQWGKPISTKNLPRASQHMLFYPGKRKYPPTSPRNILMYLLPLANTIKPPVPQSVHGTSLGKLVYNLMVMVNFDQGQKASILHQQVAGIPSKSSSKPTNEPVGDGPQPKRRKYASRNPAEATDFSDDLDMVTSSVSQRTQFMLFSEQMHMNGYIQWRKHSEEQDVIVMNDYCCETGKLKPLEYVHVTVKHNDSDHLEVQCSCRIYSYDDTILDQNKTCMHCRFYKEYLVPVQANLTSQDCINKLHQKVKQHENEINSPVILLGEPSPTTSTKFSVVGEDSFSLVHVHFSPSGCIASCQNGLCSHYNVRCRVPKVISLDQLSQGNRCPHLYTLYRNNDILEELFPEYFKEPTTDTAEDGTDPSEIVEPEVINTDDIGLNKKPGNISFDINEGKWKCNSHSMYKPPLDRHDPDLVQCSAKRFQTCTPLPTGFLKGPDLFTSMEKDGEPRKCLFETDGVPCHEVYTTETELQKRPVTVYTRYVSMIAIV